MQRKEQSSREMYQWIARGSWLGPSCPSLHAKPPNLSVMHAVHPPASLCHGSPLSQRDKKKQSNSQTNMSIYRRSPRGNSRHWVTHTWLDEGSMSHGGKSLSTLHFSQHDSPPHSQNALFLHANLLSHHAILHHLNLSLSSQLVPFPACHVLI